MKFISNHIKYFSHVSSCLLVLTILGAGLTHAYGDIRSDIEALKKEKNSLRQQEADLLSTIIQQKDVIKEKERLYYDARNFEKQKRDEVGSSWTSFDEHDKAVIALSEAKRVWDESKAKLQSLYDSRNTAIAKLRLVEEKLLELNETPLPRIIEPGKLVGISLDKSCRVMNESGINSSCPTFEELNLIYPDIGCTLGGEKCLLYHKQTDGGRGYIINPDLEVSSRIEVIEIRANFDEYLLKGISGYDDANHSLKYNDGIYTSRRTTFIDGDRWFTLLGQVIWWLYGGEDPSSSRYEYLNQTEHDITTSYKYQLDKWIKESKEKCINKCFEY
jgi:hypothetical protein